MALNGMSATDFPKKDRRYRMQWMAELVGDSLVIKGYCVRDRETFSWPIVFKHTSKEACEKMEQLLNEGT